ncbi:MAG TPA: hypothetical protein ENG51_14540 [Deltaproteobacteria bacterium]|nr:hypothetical protein [Deltaproteobacteria bacterium]
MTVCKRRVYNERVYFFTLVIWVTERTITSDGQMMLFPDHSKFKTDLDIERLPSGKFATNVLILSLAALAYNILCIIGELGLMGWESPFITDSEK